MPHTGATMRICHFINENRSDMRGVKPGWYAIDDHGKLSRGPFSSREECLSSIHTRNEPNPTSTGVKGGASGPDQEPPLKGLRS